MTRADSRHKADCITETPVSDAVSGLAHLEAPESLDEAVAPWKKYGATIILDSAPCREFRIEDTIIGWDGKGGIACVQSMDQWLERGQFAYEKNRQSSIVSGSM